MNILELFASVRVFVFDIDGVLTDGMLHVQENGELLRRMNIKDGYALQLAVKKGYKVWVISGGKTLAVKKRLEKLGVSETYIDVKDKAGLLEQKMKEAAVSGENMLYMGDDMPDMAAMQLCRLKTCPSDAIAEIRSMADYISPYPAGAGCVRDAIEKVLKINGHWE